MTGCSRTQDESRRRYLCQTEDLSVKGKAVMGSRRLSHLFEEAI